MKEPFITSRNKYPSEIVGLPEVDKALRHLRSVKFMYGLDETQFRLRAHPHEYGTAKRALDLAVSTARI